MQVVYVKSRNKEIFFKPVNTIMEDGQWRSVEQIQKAWIDLPRHDGLKRKKIGTVNELRSYLRLNQNYEMKEGEVKEWRKKV